MRQTYLILALMLMILLSVHFKMVTRANQVTAATMTQSQYLFTRPGDPTWVVPPPTTQPSHLANADD